MKRVVQIVLLISFLVAVFIFASPWLYYWAAPVVEPFSTAGSKFYVYDLEKDTKTLVYSKKGLGSIEFSYFDEKNHKILFLKRVHPEYIFQEMYFGRCADAFASVDLKTKELNKLRKFDCVSEVVYPPFYKGHLYLMDGAYECQKNLMRYNMENQEDMAIKFSNCHNGSTIVPLGNDEYLFTFSTASGPLMVKIMRDGNEKVLLKQKGKVLSYSFGLLHGGNVVGFTISDCEWPHPNPKCIKRYFLYDAKKHKVIGDRTFPARKMKNYWFWGAMDERNVVLLDRKGNALVFLDMVTGKTIPYYTFHFHHFPYYGYENGRGIVPLNVFRKSSREMARGKENESSEKRLADAYLFDIVNKKLRLVEKGVRGGISAVAWNDAGDKMLYVVLN